MKKSVATVLIILAMVLVSFGTVLAENRIIIGILPEINLAKQMEKYSPLCKYLGRQTGMEVGVKPLANYGLIYEELRDGKIDAGFFGSLVYGLTRARLGIEPVARPVRPDGVSTYAGYTFARKDSGIKGPKDMKGRRIALVDPATTAGYLAQKIYFKKHGIDIDKDVKIFWTGSHDAAAMAVFNKQADAGGAKNHPYNKIVKDTPSFGDAMQVLDDSPEVPDNALAVKKAMDPKTREKLRNALLNMEKDKEGMQILKNFGAARFIETKDSDYKHLYEMAKEAGIDLKTYPYKKQ
ncbi:MAG: phosphate/phosphite/phosphonate ABC transporter substrate-binding protein [Nitrospirae bacterium]|nr:phosphate/phosphite/phosphonate ABC transporter substrate-binding protein [Nitrospirota bacterium]